MSAIFEQFIHIWQDVHLARQNDFRCATDTIFHDYADVLWTEVRRRCKTALSVDNKPLSLSKQNGRISAYNSGGKHNAHFDIFVC